MHSRKRSASSDAANLRSQKPQINFLLIIKHYGYNLSLPAHSCPAQAKVRVASGKLVARTMNQMKEK